MATPYIEFWGGRNAMVLGNSQLLRKVNVPSDWSSLRIGVLYGFTSGSFPIPYTISGNQLMVVGLCSGSQGVFDSPCGHFFGFITSGSHQLSSSVGNNNYLSINTAYAFRRSSASLDLRSTDFISQPVTSFMATPANIGPTALYVRITKGTPNYTAGVYYCSDLSGGPTISNCLYESFLREMQSGDPAFSARDSSSLQASETTTNIAVDETASGSFDHINVAWNRERPDIELLVYAIAVGVLA